ncbi:MAG: DUF86 domain-containing protein, partial [Spirochaetales bacterium]|nr:DUF86 domain-containing protein [Spirochaetales bacterium]
MDDLIRRKLESLRRCLDRIITKRPVSIEILKSDYDIQDIISLNLERTIQLCVDIGSYLLAESEQTPPDTMGEVFTELALGGFISETLALKLRKAVGFRNISVHEYQSIDWEIVFAIIH